MSGGRGRCEDGVGVVSRHGILCEHCVRNCGVLKIEAAEIKVCKVFHKMLLLKILSLI